LFFGYIGDYRKINSYLAIIPEGDPLVLIEFSVTNFRSIKERQVFSMMPAGKIKLTELSDNVISKDSNEYGLSLLKSTVFYGANASGKSNFLRALGGLKHLVIKSIDYKLDENIKPYEPFKLNKKNNQNPVEFEIDFIAKDRIRYLYKVVFTGKEFLFESLFFYPQRQRSKLFIREKGKPIQYGDYFKGIKKHQLLNNQLLLSKAGTTLIEPLIEPYRFFSTYLFRSIFHGQGLNDALLSGVTKLLMGKKGEDLQKNIHKLLCKADTGITDFTTKELTPDDFDFPNDFPEEEKNKIVDRYKYRIKTLHNLYDDENLIGKESFDLREESAGTIKLFVVGLLMLDALSDGSVIIIDELDKSLHPNLTRMLIKLFHNEKNNPNHAQLIFATHDISMIDITLLRRDQIWLTEKDSYGATEIYPLSDFTGISKVKTLDNWYLHGRFGGVPKLYEAEFDLVW